MKKMSMLQVAGKLEKLIGYENPTELQKMYVVYLLKSSIIKNWVISI